MKIYVVSNSEGILDAYTDKNKAKTQTINYIKSFYNQNENNIYIDEYDNFILYNIKHNDNWVTLKINEITVK